MNKTLEIGVVEVKRVLETANENQSLSVFLDRQGDINHVSEPAFDDDTWIRLHEEARAVSGGPFFQILSNSPNGLFTHDGQNIFSNDDETLSEAIKQADEERTRFYEEKEAEFGPTAWPLSA